MRDKFKRGVATAAGTIADKVMINAVTAKARRQRLLLADAVEVDFSVEMESAEAAAVLVGSDKLALEGLNSALQAEGVAPITAITAAPTVTDRLSPPPVSRSGTSAGSTVLALAAAVVALQLAAVV